jgi:hypothetical protein
MNGEVCTGLPVLYNRKEHRMDQKELENREKALKDKEKALNHRERTIQERENASVAMETNKRMIQPLPSNTKMIKVKAIRSFSYTARNGKKTMADPGSEVEVPENEAKEILERKYKGNYGFSGERYNNDGDTNLQDIRIAVPV